MPKSGFKYIFLTVFLLSRCLFTGGQTLPSLKTAPEISAFALPCGLQCYVVTCKSETSRADLSLIQAGSAQSRSIGKGLDSLSHFPIGRAEQFLKANAIAFNSEKYPFNGDEASIFRLESVDVGASAVMDSSILMLFDLAMRCPFEQALVVSGDIAAASVSEKLKAFSMLMPRRSALPPKAEKSFVHQGFPTPETFVSGQEEEVRMTFSAARIPRKAMSTLQPALTRMFFRNLSAILQLRMKAALRDAGLPFSRVSFRYTDSSQSDGDETYRISVGTERGCGEDVSRVLGNVIASVAAGVGEDEFREARERTLMEERIDIALDTETNYDYTRRCASNFIFGSSLAPRSAENDYFAARPLPLPTECKIFNDFVAALFDGCPSPAGQMKGILAMGDTLSLRSFSTKRKDALKITLEAKETVSGGQMWTFSNGIRVIYKKVPTKGVFQYSLMLRGGCGDIPGFRRGEMAFIPDMLRLSRVGGMSAERFRMMLEANAITLDASASVSDLRISGTAVSEKFPLLLKSLVSLALDRETDTMAARQYMQEERLRLAEGSGGLEELSARMDSLIRPDYNYLSFKNISNLSKDLPARSQQYFSSQFAKFNDGVLVIFGDMDEAMVRSQLCRYLSPLKVSASFAVKPLLSYSLRSGCTTYTEKPASEGGRYRVQGIFWTMNSLTDFSVHAYMGVQMAAELLENRLRLSLGRYGYHVRVRAACEFFPLERAGVSVTVIPGRSAERSPLEMVPIVRESLAGVLSSGVNDAQLKTLKANFTKEYESRLSSPAHLMALTLARYSDSKDFVTDYKSRIASVTREDINGILSHWDNGGKIEYIVSR